MKDFFKNKSNLNYFQLEENCPQENIDVFEQKFNIFIPKDFKDFLLFSNGAELVNIENNLLTINNDFKVRNIFKIFSIERIENELLFSEKPYTTIFYDMMLSNEKIENQEHLIIIGISETAYFFVGHSEPFTNKVFIYYHAHGAGDDGIIDDSGCCIYPVHFVANSFSEYLKMLIKNEEFPFA